MPQRSKSRVAPIERALAAKRESKYVDFKERFDPDSDGEWCELLKDFAAIANVGGGIVVIGIRNNGTSSGADVHSVLELDSATITDKLFKYTGQHYSGFEIHEAKRMGNKVAVIGIEGVEVPIVFTKPGTYLVAATGKQKTAFSKGTVYFRHGAKSEPGTSDDLRSFIDGRVVAAREAWLGNVRKVVEAPADAQVAVYRSTSSGGADRPARIQLTTDPNAPVYGKLDPDESHPYRQKELISEVNRRLPGRARVNSYDILCVRRTHDIDQKTAAQFCHRPKFGYVQYSEAFVDWLIDQQRKDKKFFASARERHYEGTHAG
jgi:hypothetical protein